MYLLPMLGSWLDWTTQQWVKKTGRRLNARSDPWLDGPVGDSYIGDRWLESYAESLDAVSVDDEGGGLAPDLSALDQPGLSEALLDQQVVDFYQSTSDWRLEVWSR